LILELTKYFRAKLVPTSIAVDALKEQYRNYSRVGGAGMA
jgi:hypothetical protein